MKSYLVDGRAKPLAGYPHLKRARGFLFLSGTSARRADGSVAGVERRGDEVIRDIGAQTEAVLANLGALLAAAGAGLEHLVEITTFLVNMDDYAGYNEVWNRHFTADTGPARTTVAVASLPGKDLLIEMRAVALDPSAGATGSS